MQTHTAPPADPTSPGLHSRATATGAVARILRQARRERRATLAAHNANKAAAAFGIPVPHGLLLQPHEIGEADLSGLTEPFAIKFISPQAVHKSDLGAVRVGVAAADVAAACRSMLDSPELRGLDCDGLLVEEMAVGSAELVIGGRLDDSFGPVVMVGIGGVLLEIVDDVSFRICPVDEREARAMLAELRGSRLLSGYRGGDPVNLDAVVDVIGKVAGSDGLLMSFADKIAELDINPLIVGVDGAVACDVRIVLAARAEDGAPGGGVGR